jgi:ribosome maturation factor RimP
VDVEVKRAPGGQFVRIYVDKEGGIGIDELQLVSEEVAAILDVEDPLATAYTLEVSSPGLDRPLKGEGDFLRFLGRLANVSTYEPVSGRRHWTGRLMALADGVLSLSLENEGKQVAKIPLDKIAHARLEVEFPRQA